MSGGKSDRVLIALGAVLGAFAGAAAGFFTIWMDGPDHWSPVGFVLTSPQGGPATLVVNVLGTWQATQTAAKAEDFDTELILLRHGPGVALIGLGGACGGLFGYVVGRWANTKRAPV